MISLNISLITANYNNSIFLEDYFLSILKSKYILREIIFIDDNSDDNSLEIAYEYSKQLPTLNVVPLKKRHGFAKALNIGIELSIGKYIMRLDSDDFIEPYRIIKQYTYLENNIEIDIVGSNVYYYNTYLKKVIFTSNFPIYHKEIRKYLISGKYGMIHGSVMGKSNIFKKFKYRAHEYPAEDYEFFSRLLIHNVKFHNIHIPLTYYRIHHKNSSYIHSKLIINKIFHIRKNYFNINENQLIKFLIIAKFYFYRKALLSKKSSLKYLYLFISLFFAPNIFKTFSRRFILHDNYSKYSIHSNNSAKY